MLRGLQNANLELYLIKLWLLLLRVTPNNFNELVAYAVMAVDTKWHLSYTADHFLSEIIFH